MQVDGAADLRQLAGLAQFAGDRDRIRRFASSVEVDDGVEDGLVVRPVEVDAAQHLDHIGDGVLRHHHGAEHTLLGREILGRGAVQLTVVVDGSLGHGTSCADSSGQDSG